MDKLKTILKQAEGLSLKPYDDMGDMSIGHGRNLTQIGISPIVADLMLGEDITRCWSECNKSYRFFSKLDQVRKESLVELNFNMGQTRLALFRKMLGALAKGDWAKGAEELLDSQYARQLPARAKRIAEQLRTGEYEF